MAKAFDPIWTDSPVPVPDLGGDLATQRGGDPLITVDSPNGLQPVWKDAFVPDPSSSETPNPVSGLPAHPDRFQPSGTPPPPPTLKDRSPGTIDEQ